MYYAKRQQMIVPYNDKNENLLFDKEIDFTELKESEVGETRLNDFGFDGSTYTR